MKYRAAFLQFPLNNFQGRAKYSLIHLARVYILTGLLIIMIIMTSSQLKTLGFLSIKRRKTKNRRKGKLFLGLLLLLLQFYDPDTL